jgi:release factor glutamine methyltransferase
LVAAARASADLAELTVRRCGGVPLEHVLGWARFRSLRLAVTTGVFVPRPRTEFLVECLLPGLGPGACVVDLCCGCGAIGAAVLAERPDVVLHAVDVDPRAVECARANLDPAGGRAHLGDLYAPLPAPLRGAVDAVVANAPYVPSEQLVLLPVDSRLHEPRSASDGGPDGTALQRRIVAESANWLRPGGRLFLETSARQAATVVAVVEAAGLDGRVVRDEERDATVVLGSTAQP